MKVEYHEAASLDVLEAIDYYRSKSPALALRFRNEFDASVAAILAAPKRWALWRSGMRRYLMPSFPFAICYLTISPDFVRIVIVRHHSRKPGYGTRRK